MTTLPKFSGIVFEKWENFLSIKILCKIMKFQNWFILVVKNLVIYENVTHLVDRCSASWFCTRNFSSICTSIYSRRIKLQQFYLRSLLISQWTMKHGIIATKGPSQARESRDPDWINYQYHTVILVT
jgi:hypothetical protein